MLTHIRQYLVECDREAGHSRICDGQFAWPQEEVSSRTVDSTAGTTAPPFDFILWKTGTMDPREPKTLP